MSLEAKIDELIKSLDANTAAVKASKGATGTGGSSGGTGKDASKPKNSVEQVKAAAVAVKEKFDTATCKKLIKDVGKADELAKIEPKNYDAFVAACEKKIAEEDAGGGDDL